MLMSFGSYLESVHSFNCSFQEPYRQIPLKQEDFLQDVDKIMGAAIFFDVTPREPIKIVVAHMRRQDVFAQARWSLFYLVF
jgi:hypothetical protein